MARTSANQKAYIEFISNNPLCCVADVDRACRINPRAGHKWVYDGIARLERRGLLKSYVGRGGRKLLALPEWRVVLG